MTFPIALDSTMIAAFRSCPQRFFREYFEHWKPKLPSVHLHAGGAYAKGLEIARRAYYEEGDSADDAIARGLQALITTYGDFECPSDSAKSCDRMAGALEYYFSIYPLDSDPAVPLTLPNGRRAIEFSFAIPVEIKHPDSGDPILYCGRSDMFVEWAGGIYGLDDKTTSSLGASWARQWTLRSQFTGYCLTGDTEVLTPTGWHRLDSLKPETQVMQWANGQLDFVTPTAYHKPHYTGPMHKMTGKVSFTATPEHRVPVFDAYTDAYKTFTIKNLPKNSGALRFISAGWKTDGEILNPALLKLLVAIQADGSYRRTSDGAVSGVRFHFVKKRKFERLIALLRELNLEYKFYNTKNYSVLIKLCPEVEVIEALLGPNKKWDFWLLSLSGESLSTIMEELRYWDGAINGEVYCTADKDNADWIKTIASLCGMRGSIHTQQGWKTNNIHYRTCYSKSHLHSVHLHVEEQVEHDGSVYCLTVPSSYFLIRVNGKISVTGNCWAAQQCGIDASGMIVRGTSILKTKYDHAQAITYRAPFLIEKWYEQLHRDLTRMVVMYRNWKDSGRSDAWDSSLDHACTEYSGCIFTRVCESPDADTWLPMYFDKRVWSPLTREEKEAA